jgi:LytR cell envelope-related transcriptional attenuator
VAETVTNTLIRRPLPALISLVALLLLTGLVWWRVLHRGSDDAHGAAPTCSTPAVQSTLPAPAKIRVQVFNSTSRSGIGAKARTALVEDGFDIPKPAANDPRTRKVTAVAEIRYGPNGADGAKLLSYYFPGAHLVHTTSKTATVVVSLGEKYRRVAPAATVRAALRTQKVAVGSTAPSAGATVGATCSTPTR